MLRNWCVRAEAQPGIWCAWRGPALLVLDDSGAATAETLAGFFFRETRYLSHLALRLNGESPFRCSAAQVNANRLEFTYIYPPVDVGAGGGSGSGGQSQWRGILRRGIDIRFACDVHPSWVDVTAELTSRWDERVEVDVAWLLGADYVDMPEAQSGRREQQAAVHTATDATTISFRYQHPELPLETRIEVDMPEPWEFRDNAVTARLTFDRQKPRTLRLRILAVDHANPLGIEEGRRREEALHARDHDAAYLISPRESPLVGIVNRAIADVGSFSLLEGSPDEWLTPGAGVPLYLSLWGRDALTAVWQAAAFDRGEMAVAALARLGRTQGTRVDPERDEEPGRIIQQARAGPLDRLGKTPFSRYYADQASPFDYIFALAHAFACSGELDLVRRHWDTCRRITEWADRYGDRDGDGFLEYQTTARGGPRHQGWKDSDNAVVYEDGRQATTPLAACEVQGYWYAALQVMAALAGVLGHGADALAWWRAAVSLKERFNRQFWMPEEGSVALGLDSEKRQMRSITSNAGQCIATGIVAEEHMPRLVRRLFEPDLFSGWGIRTLSAKNPAYNPLDYHLGSVWLIENATIVFGLRRFGFDERAVELARALYDLALLWPAQRVPECVGGYARREFVHPGAYPRANAPQMWNESAWLLIMQTLLGLQPLAPLDTLAVDPALPEWLPEVTLHRLRIGGARVTLHFRREPDGSSTCDVLQKEGTLHILRQPSPDSLRAGPWDRLKALFEGPVSV
jgi:glycogen debranching enzyme